MDDRKFPRLAEERSLPPERDRGDPNVPRLLPEKEPPEAYERKDGRVAVCVDSPVPKLARARARA
jgi:hypothetical protein